jgi:ComF family protein
MSPNPPDWQANGAISYSVTLFAYEGPAALAVRRLKYERITSLAMPMSDLLAKRADEFHLLEGAEVVPVPIHWTRKCQRGFNQAELLAERIPGKICLALARTRATRPQAGLSTAERRRDLDDAFGTTCDVRGRRFLLVDDVLTTGQTAQACAKVLLAAGALDVGVLAFAGNP